MAPPRPGLEWQERLETARTLAEVVEASEEFVSRFAPSLLAQLPRACLPPLRLDADAISDYAVELVRRELADGAAATPILSTFAMFFTDAAQAVARIAMARRRPQVMPPVGAPRQ